MPLWKSAPPANDPTGTPEVELSATFGPSRLAAFLIGLLIVALLYRRVTTLGKLTVAIWIGVTAMP